MAGLREVGTRRADLHFGRLVRLALRRGQEMEIVECEVAIDGAAGTLARQRAVGKGLDHHGRDGSGIRRGGNRVDFSIHVLTAGTDGVILQNGKFRLVAPMR